MKHIAAYMLLSLGKEEKPTADDVTKLLSTCLLYTSDAADE